ncbi:MAG: cysteine desulfurase family protein [Desulfobacterales bacterium]|jgi:cysteine desulfurase
MNNAYLDHASATPVRKEVLKAMLPYYREQFANPSNVYDPGTQVKAAVEDARASVAGLINAQPAQIVFTASGAEANNLAIKGVAFAKQKKGNHLIVSAIEHHSVLNSVRFLERLEYEATFLPVDQTGLVDPARLEKAIRPETVMVSIMHANTEIGTIEPVAELAAICKANGVVFHTDAVASVGNIPVDVNGLNVDLLSLSGASLGAAKGIGALYFNKKVRLMPLIHGGIQENGRRAGTENVPAIIGMGTAAALAKIQLPAKIDHVRKLRDRLVDGILKSVEKVSYTGHPEKRLPGHASFCFEAIEGEALIFMLAQNGIYTNTGSACASKALKTSPVLGAIGLRTDLAQGSTVFSIDAANTAEQIDYVLEKLPPIVARLRALSPIWGKEIPEYEAHECEH